MQAGSGVRCGVEWSCCCNKDNVGAATSDFAPERMPDWMGRLLMYQDCILAIWRPRQDSLSAGQEDYVSGWALGWAGLSWAGLARCVCPCVRILKTFKRWTLELERDAHQRMPRPVSSHPRILVSSGICILNEYITFICHIPNTPKLKKLRVPAITCAGVCVWRVCAVCVCCICINALPAAYIVLLATKT